MNNLTCEEVLRLNASNDSVGLSSYPLRGNLTWNLLIVDNDSGVYPAFFCNCLGLNLRLKTRPCEWAFQCHRESQ